VLKTSVPVGIPNPLVWTTATTKPATVAKETAEKGEKNAQHNRDEDAKNKPSVVNLKSIRIGDKAFGTRLAI